MTGKSGDTSIYSFGPFAWNGNRYRTVTAAIQDNPKADRQRLLAAAKSQLLAAVFRIEPGAEIPEAIESRRMRERRRAAERHVPDPVLVELSERCNLGQVEGFDLPDVDEAISRAASFRARW